MLIRIDVLRWKRLIATTGAMLLSCVVFSQSATAALIADYQFAANLDGVSSVSGVLSSTPGTFTLGAGLSAASSGVGTPARSVAFDDGAATATDLANAIATDDFVTFTITPDAGTPLDLTELRFDSQRSTPTAVTDWTLVEASDTGTSLASGALAVPMAAVVFETETADLTGIASLQGITTAKTFRIYFYGYVSGASQQFRIDTVQLDGVEAAVIPEPSSLVLMAGLFMGSVMVRRRR